MPVDPVRGAERGTVRSTTGAATCSTTSSACCPNCWPADGAPRHAAVDRRPGAATAAARRARAPGARRRLSFFPFGAVFEANKPQIERVEQLSDAYHLTLGGDDVMVAYLIEIERAGSNRRLGDRKAAAVERRKPNEGGR